MIACIYFVKEIITFPRLINLLQNEFQHNLVVFENEQTIFIYNVKEITVRQTMLILETAGIEAGYGMGENKNESLNRAIMYVDRFHLKEGI